MRARLPLAVTAIAASLACAGAARAQAPVTLTATAGETGWIGASLVAVPGTRVALAEDGHVLRRVTAGSDGRATVRHLAAWACRPLTRTITASVAGAPVAASSVATPPCTDRYALRVPRRARAGSAVAVRVTDRWRVGGPTLRACLRFGGRDVQCAATRPGARSRTVRLTPVRTGRATVTLSSPGTPTLRATLRVRARDRRLRVLAAGDSMMQVLDGDLADRLPGARVRSDAHVSTGITKPAQLDWPARARRLARSLRPDAAVVFLGANDGFGLPVDGRLEPCCSDAWVGVYAARARAMMAAFARDGAGRVYWLTLPVPRSAAFARIYAAVNRALRQAARAHPETVRIVDTGRVFTPDGRFRQSIRRDGRTVGVRQADGVHLTPAGDRIAAGLVVAAMRRDGLVR